MILKLNNSQPAHEVLPFIAVASQIARQVFLEAIPTELTYSLIARSAISSLVLQLLLHHRILPPPYVAYLRSTLP